MVRGLIPSTDPPAYVMLDVLPVSFAFGMVPAAHKSELEGQVKRRASILRDMVPHLPVSIATITAKSAKPTTQDGHCRDVLLALITCPLRVRLVEYIIFCLSYNPVRLLRRRKDVVGVRVQPRSPSRRASTS
jgi:hypothetical protein